MDLRGKNDYNWPEKHNEWIQIWNNRNDYIVTGMSANQPLYHYSDYMQCYLPRTRKFISPDGAYSIGSFYRMPSPTPTTRHPHLNNFICMLHQGFLNHKAKHKRILIPNHILKLNNNHHLGLRLLEEWQIDSVKAIKCDKCQQMEKYMAQISDDKKERIDIRYLRVLALCPCPESSISHKIA
ncbi:unnamed protein product [Lupinus luteus]|uniref:Uncharacterized protein n=1 Tax=Lupinus luteus TaxID=3873 RepID=A0AAV1WAR8_LUPLU